MLYDEYKKKMEKAYIIKNKILKFKYPAIVLISSLIIAFVIIAVMMGRSSGIEIASNFTYGDTIEYSCNPYMSEVIRYEFSSKEDSNWTEEVPTYVGDYQIRAISKGMFGEKVASVKDFSIDKKILNIDIVENKILYGTYPKTSLDGILSTDSLSGISYTFEDLSKSETTITITLSGIQIIDSNGVDVTSCYQMYSNATSGQSIEFEPRSIGLVPDISDKVYDGLALVYNNTYTVLYNEIGYEDEIVVTSSIKNSKNEVVSEAIVPDTYTISIENIYINGSSNYTNYTVTTSTKEVEITKRDIVIETSSQEKIYDGTYLEASSSSDIYLSSGYTLAYNDTLSLSTNTSKILNVGEKSNVLEAIIYNSNNEDVTDYYNISYNYGTLKVSERDLYITSSSSTKVYDGTALSSKSYTYTNLVEGESINLVSNNSIKELLVVVLLNLFV